MNLDFFNNLSTNDKEHGFILKFIDELSEYLNDVKKDFIESQIGQNSTIFFNVNELISKYKISYTFLDNFYERCNKALKEYCNSLDNDEDFYYVSWNNNIYDNYDINNIYTIDKYSRTDDVVRFSINGGNLPKNVQKGMILKKNGSKYELDVNATNCISKNFKNIAEEIAVIQDDSMKKYRKEDNLYVVVEKCPHSVYLQDVNSNVVFEDINFPKDIFDLLCNDSVVSFKNGSYMYEKEITDSWFNSFISKYEHEIAITELMNINNLSKIDFHNISFNIVSHENDYSILGYGRNNNYTLKVPNKLIDYWANDNSILYYDCKDKFFYRKL